jgi:hypothetical protein
MRLATIPLAILASACTAPPPASPTDIPELAGRTAGAPQRCVTFQQGESLHIAGPHTLTYRDGRTLWVNAVPSCSPLRFSDSLVTDPFGTQYCSGDIVRTRDNSSLIPGPSCRLNDFVPYRKG